MSPKVWTAVLPRKALAVHRITWKTSKMYAQGPLT